MTRPAIIVRLSREDLKAPGSLEEKMQRHLAMSRDLVTRYNLPQPAAEDIFLESGVSGRKLSRRPETRRLLDKCAAGYYTHLVCAYQDRLLRGDKRDEADVEDALIDGCVTLITSEGVIQFDDTYESSNAFMFEIRAASARNYVRDVIRKVKESNKQRTMAGNRSAGIAPYGYYWQVARYEQRRLIEAAHYELVGDLTLADRAAALQYCATNMTFFIHDGALDEAAYLARARRIGQADGSLLPGVECTGGEYAILLEIFRRIRTEGYGSILRDLNNRGIPTPGATRFKAEYASTVWHESTLRNIVKNLHYSGFPAHTVTTDRKGRKIKLPPEKHILPNEEQPFPHPIRLPDQRQLLQRITDRAAPGSARPRSATLLSGLVRCSEGQPCRANSDSYDCRCGFRGRPHLGANVARALADRNALALLRQAIDAMPPAAAPRPSHACPDAATALISAEREIARKRRDLEDLRKHSATFARAGGSDAFAAAIAGLEQEIADMERSYQAIQSDTREREARHALTALEELRTVDFEEFWEAADIHQRRAILRLVIDHLQIVPQPARGKRILRWTLTVQPWVRPYFNPGTVRVHHAKTHTGPS